MGNGRRGFCAARFQARENPVSKAARIPLVFKAFFDGNELVSCFISPRFPFPRLKSGNGNERSRLAGQFVFPAFFGEPTRSDGRRCHFGNLPL